jgi:hypothetical protein
LAVDSQIVMRRISEAQMRLRYTGSLEAREFFFSGANRKP